MEKNVYQQFICINKLKHVGVDENVVSVSIYAEPNDSKYHIP